MTYYTNRRILSKIFPTPPLILFHIPCSILLQKLRLETNEAQHLHQRFILHHRALYLLVPSPDLPKLILPRVAHNVQQNLPQHLRATFIEPLLPSFLYAPRYLRLQPDRLWLHGRPPTPSPGRTGRAAATFRRARQAQFGGQRCLLLAGFCCLELEGALLLWWLGWLGWLRPGRWLEGRSGWWLWGLLLWWWSMGCWVMVACGLLCRLLGSLWWDAGLFGYSTSVLVCLCIVVVYWAT